MPITIVPLLRLRKKLKDAIKDCDDLLSKVRDHQQMVPSLGRKVMHAVLPSFTVPNQDVLSTSIVGRFEWFAKESNKFVRDMESGCSLSHYRFLSSPIRHLLEGKSLSCRKVQGSKAFSLRIRTDSVEERGRVALLISYYKDHKAPLKNCENADSKTIRKHKHSWNYRKMFAVTWTSIQVFGWRCNGGTHPITYTRRFIFRYSMVGNHG